jgi:large repetitive protein
MRWHLRGSGRKGGSGKGGPVSTSPRARRALLGLAAVGVLVWQACSLAASASAATAPEDVTVTLSTLVNGVPSTGPLFGGSNVLEYQLAIKNAGSAASSSMIVYDNIPRAASYVAGSATCGSTPGCTVSFTENSIKVTHEGTVTFNISSVAAGATEVVGFQVSTRQGSLHQKVEDLATWHGAGCSRNLCKSNKINIPVIPRPVQLTALPLNGAIVQTAEAIDYILTVKNTSSTAQSNVVVTDPVPAGTTYYSGSATCNGNAGCAVSLSDNTLKWTIASVAPRSKGIKLGYSVSVNSDSGSIKNTAAWTGDLCTGSSPCATNTVAQNATAGLGFEVTKTNSPTSLVAAGGTITYGFQITNDSSVSVTSVDSVVITDAIPSGTTYVQGSASCGTFSSSACSTTFSNDEVKFTITNMPPSSHDIVSFKVTVNASASNTAIANTALFTGLGFCVTSSGCPTNTVTQGGSSPTTSTTASTSSSTAASTQSTPTTAALTAQPSSSSSSSGPLAFTGTGLGTTLLAAIGAGLILLATVTLTLASTFRRRISAWASRERWPWP